MGSEECHCYCHQSGNATIVEHTEPCCLKCHFCFTNIPVSAVSEHKKICSWAKMSVLDTELEYFEQHRMEWFEGHAGQFALIEGVVLQGFYNTWEDALEAGYSYAFGNTTFLIKEIQLKDEVIFMPDRVVIDLFKGIQDDYVI